MKESKKFAVKVAGVAAIAALTVMSAFADSRHRDETYRRGDRNGRYERGEGRGNRAVTMQGRISNVSRYRDGYRVQLDRQNQWYYVPSHAMRGRSGLSIGLNIRFGGYYNNDGYVHVDSCDFIDDGYYDDRYDDRYGRNNDRYGYGRQTLHGIVDRVDYYRSELILRDTHGRRVRVEMRRNSRGIDLNDLRRGDRITLTGRWDRNEFEAFRIDSVRSGRW